MMPGVEARLSVFRCRSCGRQYLARGRCCRVISHPAPIQNGQVVDSRPLREGVTASVLLPIGHRIGPVRRTVASLLRFAAAEIEVVFVAARPSRGALDYVTALATRVSVRLLPMARKRRLAPGRQGDLGARAARGARLVLMRPGFRLRSRRQWQAVVAALTIPGSAS